MQQSVGKSDVGHTGTMCRKRSGSALGAALVGHEVRFAGSLKAYGDAVGFRWVALG
jgi:hypothetical protein